MNASKEAKIKEIYLWCPTCCKTVKIYSIEITTEQWIMLNPHEHYVQVGLCPRTAWVTKDLKEERHPQLGEVLKLCEDVNKLHRALRLLSQIEKEK